MIGWLPGMLAAPSPERAEISAVEYYRPDDRFAPETNAARIALAQDAARAGGAGFATTWERVERLCAAEPEGRVVRTRHGDAMLLSQFLLTRVVEVAVHGLDVADALGRDPWLTPQAADAVLELLLGPGHRAAAGELGWDQAVLLRKATKRSPLSPTEAEQVRRLGIRWLTLG